MLDIDYCNGQNCPVSNICQRFADYLHKVKMKQDIRYARAGQREECPQFQAKAYVGN